MKFWDSSSIVPLLVGEPPRKRMLQYLERDPVMLVWWASPVEIVSAIARREREGHLKTDDTSAVLERLARLSQSWHEVQPTAPLRTVAQRMLRVHALRAADALQLAAAVAAADGDPASLDLVCLDDRLAEAARREGFRILA